MRFSIFITDPCVAVRFLNDLDRISDPNWRPSNEDILFARLKTVGLETHLFEIPGTKKGKHSRWRIADVGGSVSQVSQIKVIRLYNSSNMMPVATSVDTLF